MSIPTAGVEKTGGVVFFFRPRNWRGGSNMTGFDRASRHVGPNVRLTADSGHPHQGRFRSEIDPTRQFLAALGDATRPNDHCYEASLLY